MKTKLSSEEAAAYGALAHSAKLIQARIDGLRIAIMDAPIPDGVKIKIFDRMDDKCSFDSLAYFLTPQTEWLGGDSSDPKNFAVMSPHIAR